MGGTAKKYQQSLIKMSEFLKTSKLFECLHYFSLKIKFNYKQILNSPLRTEEGSNNRATQFDTSKRALGAKTVVNVAGQQRPGHDAPEYFG